MNQTTISSRSNLAPSLAARLDGASERRIFWSVGLPLMATGLVTVALLSFVGAWNSFFLPLIVLNRENLFPLTLGMNVWNTLIHTGGGKPIYNLVALGSLISVLRCLLPSFSLAGIGKAESQPEQPKGRLPVRSLWATTRTRLSFSAASCAL